MHLPNLLAERTCSPATAGVSGVSQGQTEHVCVAMCVCASALNQSLWLPAPEHNHLSRQTSDGGRKEGTMDGRWIGRQTSSYSQKKGRRRRKNNTVYFITWNKVHCRKWVLSTNGPSISPHINGLMALDLSLLDWKQWSEKGREGGKGVEDGLLLPFRLVRITGKKTADLVSQNWHYMRVNIWLGKDLIM